MTAGAPVVQRSFAVLHPRESGSGHRDHRRNGDGEYLLTFTISSCSFFVAATYFSRVNLRQVAEPLYRYPRVVRALLA
uniref:Uncharacterized protein n=1 Tax=Escherichia coli TaxID=562 RepID=A0A3G4RTX8_ECOLX|nr:hypothetical protein D0368_00414 [Escherichia coli]